MSYRGLVTFWTFAKPKGSKRGGQPPLGELVSSGHRHELFAPACAKGVHRTLLRGGESNSYMLAYEATAAPLQLAPRWTTVLGSRGTTYHLPLRRTMPR